MNSIVTYSSCVSVVDMILNKDMDAYTRLTDTLHQILDIPAAVEVHNYRHNYYQLLHVIL